MAAQFFKSQPAGHTLQPTVLVHDVFLKLQGSDSVAGPGWDRTRFLATAARAMRHILVDHARRKRRHKHGGGVQIFALRPDEAVTPGVSLDVLNLHDALERLGAFDPRAAAVVELRFFAGLSIAETARTLGVSDWTVEEDWRVARSWLASHLAID
ncbi:MAG: hypothetical protein AMXMBFR58_25640 [Phycisphaerae bacterium]